MGKKRQKDAEPKSQNVDVSAQFGIFSTLFGSGVPEGETTGLSSLFSDDNPFRRKAEEPNPVGDEEKSESAGSDGKKGKEKKRSIDADKPAKNGDEEIAVTSYVKGKRPKKEMDNGGSNDEKDSDMGIAQEGKPVLGNESKRKKRKRDEIEKEYEVKKYGKAPEAGEEKEKKVGEKRKKSDEVADTTMVSKEGFDDESKLLRTVFVGNLPLKIKKKAILKEFSKFGEVESVRIRSVPIVDTKKTRKGAIMQKQINENASSVHAYVVFESEKSAEASLAHNMSLVGGNHIRVDSACPPRKKLKGQAAQLYDLKRTVFVGNLPFDVKDEELYQLFTSMNNVGNSVEAIRVVRDPHLNIGKGIAYVLFKTWEAANLVLKKRNWKLRDRELRLSRTKSDSTPSKRKSHASEAYSPAKKLARDKTTSSGDKEKEKLDRKAVLSYQGLRATKSGGNKKIAHQKSPGSAKTKPKGAGDQTGHLKQRKQKRPSVAARKARAKGSQENDVKRAGIKRKHDSRTPESFSRKKKPKRF
ncbi:PREDICTED: RNA-binding protein 34 [Tarenaya hassleriana]|uniref:RNA-binding protein 34 n=1 Tax=Tarenaya hassleriana TaxID=28532 RepID=UPI00053C81CC|nr:PREDICTED: RNA-binding protein 34 [Tarenaya hassleriana]